MGRMKTPFTERVASMRAQEKARMRRRELAEYEAMPNREELRARAKTDRMFLANTVLGYDFAPDTHKELFEQYPEFHEGEPWGSQFPMRDVMVLWPRGHFKTTCVMVVILIQAILVNPDIRILIMQGNAKNTSQRLREVLSHFTGHAHGSILTKLFPEFCGERDTKGVWQFNKKGLRASNWEFTTPARQRKQLAQATVTVASPKTIKTGQHFDMGIFDDLVNDQNYRSRALLRRVQEDFDMCFPLIDPGCPRFVSGTRYAFGDLYEVIVKRSRNDAGEDRLEWKISIKTCWNDDGSVRFPQFVGKDGNSHGFTLELLRQIMRDNPGMFASQYLNRPMLESQQILTAEDMEKAAIAPDRAPALGPAVLFIDLAAEGDTEPDDSVVIIGKTDQVGKMYAVGGNGGKWTIPQLANNVIVYALQCRPAKILIEETASAKYFVEYVRMVCRDKGITLPLDYMKVDNQKNAKQTRIRAWAGHVKNGRFFFFIGLPYWDRLVKQATEFTGAKHQHDDYPDTMALMMTSFSGKYLSAPPPAIPVQSHDIIAILERDVAMNPYPANIELPQTETMGSEFAA